MLVVIDVGNTHTVVGVYDGQELVQHFRLSSDRERTEDEYGAVLGQLLGESGVQVSALRDAAIACVVPPLRAVFERVCLKRFGVTPLVVGPGVKTGMPVVYESPRDVGADRVVNGVAAYERYRNSKGGPFPVIVVDFGTATTFDVVSVKGEYVGGAIAPGVAVSTEALFVHASKLPRVELVAPASPIGKTTIASMQAGIVYGYVGLVDGMVRRMRAAMGGGPVRVVATGGVANLIAPHSETIEEVDDFLTLTGLRILHARNRGGMR